MHVSKGTIKYYSATNKQKEEKVSLKKKNSSRGKDYHLTIQYGQIKNSVSLKTEKETC